MEQKYYQMSLDEKQRVAETLKDGLASQKEVVFGKFRLFLRLCP